MISVAEFNQLDPDRADAVLRPCLDVDRWVKTIVADRPYGNRDDLLAAARTTADPLTGSEVDAALAHHPRIGQRATGSSAEADLSRSEQAGLALGGDVASRLAEGNAAYEERFGRVFLIRAAGRSGEEILTELQTRLDNDPGTEDEVVADQLRQIALLRLESAVAP